jgi:hypothetical protein
VKVVVIGEGAVGRMVIEGEADEDDEAAEDGVVIVEGLGSKELSFCMLFKELGLFLYAPPTLWCDNLGAIALASNPVYHARTKHIEVDYHFIREKVVNKDVITRYLPTLDQIADIFTKGLTTSRFLFLRDKLRVCSPPISLRGNVRLHDAAMP